jgi:hypothetical protein
MKAKIVTVLYQAMEKSSAPSNQCLVAIRGGDDR